MSHDKIKAAARKRMAKTGEPYAAALRADISEHQAGLHASAVSPQDIRAAAETYRELAPEYSDAVVASFIDKVNNEVAARAAARLAGPARPATAKPSRRRHYLDSKRHVARDAVAASAGALLAVGAIGLHGITSPQFRPLVQHAPVVRTIYYPQPPQLGEVLVMPVPRIP